MSGPFFFADPQGFGNFSGVSVIEGDFLHFYPLGEILP